MIAWLALQFARWGASERLASVLATVATAIAAIALSGAILGTWMHFHDRAVVRQHEVEVAGAITAATTAAEAVANSNDQVRASERAAADQDLRKAIKHVETTEPDQAHSAAGPAVNAVAERLRHPHTDRHAGP